MTPADIKAAKAHSTIAEGVTAGCPYCVEATKADPVSVEALLTVERDSLQRQLSEARAEVARMRPDYEAAQRLKPARASVWYMHDNHTFTRLEGMIDEICERAKVLGVESPGMLASVKLLDGNDKEVRSVGKSIHANYRGAGFTNADIAAWRASVLADPDAARLLALQQAKGTP